MARALLFDPTAGRTFVNQWQRYDWRLLQNSHVHRVDNAHDLDSAAASLTELGYLVHRLDASRWASEHDLHDAFARTMSFPAHYGRNLDALNDVLDDVARFEYGSDPATTGTAVLIDGYDRVVDIGPRLAHQVVDVFARRGRLAALLGHPMLCIVETTAVLGETGAMPVLLIGGRAAR